MGHCWRWTRATPHPRGAPTSDHLRFALGELAEGWTCRYLAAARLHAETEEVAAERNGVPEGGDDDPVRAEPSTATVRAWARAPGTSVADRGRLRPEVHRARREAHDR